MEVHSQFPIKVYTTQTSHLQPLDVNFNGPFKSKRIKLWKQERAGGKITTDNVERAVIRASKAHDLIDSNTISKAWSKSFPSCNDVIMHRHRPRHD